MTRGLEIPRSWSSRRLTKREALLLAAALLLALAWGATKLVRSVYLEPRHRLEGAIRSEALLLAEARTIARSGGAAAPSDSAQLFRAEDRATPRRLVRALERLSSGRVRITALSPARSAGEEAGGAVDIDCDGELAGIVDFLTVVERDLAATFPALSLSAGSGRAVRCRATVMVVPWGPLGRTARSNTASAGDTRTPRPEGSGRSETPREP